MEKYTKIMKELKENTTEQDWQINERQREEINNLNEKYNIKNFNDKMNCEQWQDEMEKLSFKQSKEIQDKKDKDIYNTILRNNLKVACYNQLYPIIFELLKKYKGKSCGVKTYEKFRDDFFKATNENFRISLDNNKIEIYPTFMNSYNFLEIFTSYDSENKERLRFLIDNKFYPLEQELTYIYNNNYIDNIPKYIETLRKKLAKLEEVNQQFNKELSEYRQLANIDGLKSYDKNSYRFKEII